MFWTPGDPTEPRIRPAIDQQDIIAVASCIGEARERLPELAARSIGVLVVRGMVPETKADIFKGFIAAQDFIREVAHATKTSGHPTSLALRTAPPEHPGQTGSQVPVRKFRSGIPMHFDGFFTSFPNPETNEVTTHVKYKFARPEQYDGVGHHVTYAGALTLLACRLTRDESNIMHALTYTVKDQNRFFEEYGQNFDIHRGEYVRLQAGDYAAIHQFPVAGGPNYLHGTFDTTTDRESVAIGPARIFPFRVPPPPPPPPPPVDAARFMQQVADISDTD